MTHREHELFLETIELKAEITKLHHTVKTLRARIENWHLRQAAWRQERDALDQALREALHG
jgi:hypothetical protein